ncbi:MAG: alpha/beta hydrolase, partial [Pseudomonadota bacterium]|nr:alpha/beta hydrolase [Pseudomonadota bacterium]
VDDHSYGLLCAWLGERDTHTKLKPNGAPILLIAGEDDVATPTSSLQALGETLSAPVTELKQTGHVPSVEASREFTSLIKEHFSKRDI